MSVSEFQMADRSTNVNRRLIDAEQHAIAEGIETGEKPPLRGVPNIMALSLLAAGANSVLSAVREGTEGDGEWP